MYGCLSRHDFDLLFLWKDTLNNDKLLFLPYFHFYLFIKSIFLSSPVAAETNDQKDGCYHRSHSIPGTDSKRNTPSDVCENFSVEEGRLETERHELPGYT